MQDTARHHVPYWGIDSSPEDRPGVPMEVYPPRPDVRAHWKTPEPQRKPDHRVFKRVGLEELTPVYGTMQPPRGLSGQLRRAAYAIPDHKPVHWATLLLADRLDVVESRFRGTNTLMAFGVAAGALATFLARRG